MSKNYLKIRIREIIYSKEFQAILIITLKKMNVDYYIKIKSNFNSFANQGIDYFNLFFSNNNGMLTSGYYFHLFISIIAVAATSIIYVNDKNSGQKISLYWA